MNQLPPNSIRKLSQSQAFLNKTGFGSQVRAPSQKLRQIPNYSLDQAPIFPSGKGSTYRSSSKGFQSFLTPKDDRSTLPSTIPGSPVLMRLPNRSHTPNENQLIFSPKLPKASHFNRPSSRFDNFSPPHYVSQRLSKTPLGEWDSIEEGTMTSLASPKEIDFTSDAFIAKLLFKFAGPQRERVTTTIFIGRIPRVVSIKYAQQVLQTLAQDLKSIKASKLKKHQDLLTDEMDKPDVLLAKFNAAINEIILLCHKAIADRAYKNLLDKHIKKMVTVAQQTSNVELLLCCMYIQGKVYMARCDFREAITEFRHFKDICISHKVYGRRVEAYKMLGKCYQGLKYHKTALVYFTKFLYVAWEIDSPKDELLSYDYIGIQYYYLGKLDKAEFFHNRMVGGKLEAKNSRLRQIGIVKIRLNKESSHTFANGKKGYDFDPDFEMGMGWEQGIDDDGNNDEAAGEISYRDEGFEPPVSNLEEEIENRRTMELLKRNQMDSLKIRDPQRSATLKTIPGFMKARVHVKNIDGKIRKQKTPFFGKSPIDDNESVPNKITITRPIRNGTANSLFTGKPNEHIFTSHLSRNRGLKNFAYMTNPYASYEENEANNELDSKSCEQIRKVLEKFKANLEVIKESLVAAYPGLRQVDTIKE